MTLQCFAHIISFCGTIKSNLVTFSRLLHTYHLLTIVRIFFEEIRCANKVVHFAKMVHNITLAHLCAIWVHEHGVYDSLLSC